MDGLNLSIQIECRALPFNYVLDIMQRALRELNLPFTKNLREINDHFTAELLAKTTISGHNFTVVISMNGVHRFMKWGLITGMTHITFIVINVTPPTGREKELANKAEEIAKCIDEKVYSLLPKGGG